MQQKFSNFFFHSLSLSVKRITQRYHFRNDYDTSLNRNCGIYIPVELNDHYSIVIKDNLYSEATLPKKPRKIVDRYFQQFIREIRSNSDERLLNFYRCVNNVDMIQIYIPMMRCTRLCATKKKRNRIIVANLQRHFTHLAFVSYFHFFSLLLQYVFIFDTFDI